jgi:23S rRNA (uridine2552-2'-O)-methyltransferase
VDTLRSLNLAETALAFTDFLEKGGNFVVKVFQGGDTASLMKAIHDRFANARAFKPQACRSGSFETYYLGIWKK